MTTTSVAGRACGRDAGREAGQPRTGALPSLMRLIADDSGQDLLEYALLSAIVGIAAMEVFSLVADAIRSTYTSWDTRTQDIWEPPPPQ